MRIFVYFLFCVTFFQQIAASSCEDKDLEKAILVLKSDTDGENFCNPTLFAQHRARAAFSITRHYEKAYGKSPEFFDLCTKQLSQYAKIQKEGGLLINADYTFGSIPIEFGICLGEIFGRLDLAEPLMIGHNMTKDRTYGLKELFRGYVKHWRTCPHRDTHPYRSDWHQLKTDKSIYKCCFRIIPVLQTYYNPREGSVHHHFLAHSFLQAEEEFKTNGFPEALAQIREILKENQALKNDRRSAVTINYSHPVPQEHQDTQDNATEKTTLDITQG